MIFKGTLKVCEKQSSNLIPLLKQRQLISKTSIESLEKNANYTLYTGADPSAKSLHLGNLLPLLLSFHLNINGNNIILLSGGATGVLGDPTFKVKERAKKDLDVLEINRQAIAKQQEKFFINATKYYNDFCKDKKPTIGTREYVNNLDWFGEVNLLNFLHEYGSNFKIKELINKESVKQRLQSSHDGASNEMESSLSIKEFFYQVLQGFDFYHLFKTRNCVGQIGGNDQWGNMTTGLEFMRRQLQDANDAKRFIITTPLLTNYKGEKFGKSEGNALFLNTDMTSVFEVYQFCINSFDEDVEKFLKIFTFLPLPDIDAILKENTLDKSKKIAHKALAQHMVHLIYGKEYISLCEKLTSILFNSKNLIEFINENKSDENVFDRFIPVYRFNEILQKSDLNLTVKEYISILDKKLESYEISEMLKNSALKFYNKKGEFESFKLKKNNGLLKDLLQNCNLINNKYIILRLSKKNLKIIEVK
ncbi:hypothetical protein QEN19_002027 [Hanseniaspora menglaensis]